jgi:hypothetical protein
MSWMNFSPPVSPDETLLSVADRPAAFLFVKLHAQARGILPDYAAWIPFPLARGTEPRTEGWEPFIRGLARGLLVRG